MYKMKRFKRVLALVMLFVMISMSFRVFAAGEEIEAEFGSLMVVLPQNSFEISPEVLLALYADNSTSHQKYVEKTMYDQTKGTTYLIQDYTEGTADNVYGDNMMTAEDSSIALGLSMSKQDGNTTADEMQEEWDENIRDFLLTLIDVKKKDGFTDITESDITVTSEVFMPVVEGVSNERIAFTISNKKKVTDDDCKKVKEIIEVLGKIAQKVVQEKDPQNDYSEYDSYKEYVINQHLFTVTADVSDGSQYKLVTARDLNWYWVRTKDATPTPTPTPEPEQSTFATELSYEAVSPTKDPNEIKGRMSGNTFLPPYYDNDVNKKDLDAIAFITSKTDEGIVATDGVAMANESNKANSKGWYYPDVNNKKVIAKKYLFDDYDNTRDNGMVSETVKVTGEKGGEDTQNPSIKWTFRRVRIDENENSDGSITVTITYNLPVDPASIPSDWTPIVGPDGSIHQIKRTIKKGEDYKKDVTVKQNGTDATVTTPVEKKWPVPEKIVQAGESATLLIVLAVTIIAGVVFRKRMKK